MTNGEKLARQILKLSFDYTEQDLAEALDIIESGRLLKTATRAVAAAVRQPLAAAKAPRAAKPAEKTAARPATKLDRAVQHLPDDEQRLVRSIAEGLTAKVLCPGLADLKTLAGRLGAGDERLKAARPALINLVVAGIAALPPGDRARLAAELGSGTSAETPLQQWTKIIVKD